MKAAMDPLGMAGAIKVMLEDPQPPNIEQLHHVAFDYSAITASAWAQDSCGGYGSKVPIITGCLRIPSEESKLWFWV